MMASAAPTRVAARSNSPRSVAMAARPLSATDFAVTYDLDLLDARRVHLERSLNADAAAEGADCDRTADAAATQAHDGAFEDLDALAIALDDLGRHLHGVTRGDLGQVGAELVLDDLVEHVHAAVPWSSGAAEAAGRAFGKAANQATGAGV